MRNLEATALAFALVLVNCSSEGPGDRPSAPSEGETPTDEQGISSSTVTKLAAGFGHTCAIFRAGKVLCWGANGAGQLGNGSFNEQTGPVPVTGITTAVAVAAGVGVDAGTPQTEHTRFSHSCALLSDGTVRCWGRNTYGQLGNGTTTSSSSPVTVTGISTAIAIAAGTDHSCALLNGGTVKCWGYNASGQLGNGTTTSSSTPVSVSGISTATAIAGGGMHSCARLTDGAMRCWGEGDNGRLGNGSTSDRTTPMAVTGMSTATAIAAGDAHTCARLSDSTMKCWGKNVNGQLGHGDTSDNTTPIAVTGITTATAIGLGGHHSCARLSDGTLKCWGKNTLGQIGDGTTTQRNSPVVVSGLTNVADVSGGVNFTCAFQTSGALQCWGSDTFGQLGHGTSSIQTLPIAIRPLTLNKVMSPMLGWSHSCVIWDGGSVKCWGTNEYGQLGNGTTTTAYEPVDVSGITNAIALTGGQSYTCALLADSSVKCWGRNNSGQLGNGKTSNSSTPVAVTGISTATQISAGAGHTCARLSNSTVKCWGANNEGQVGAGCSFVCLNQLTPVAVSGISTATAIGAGGFHSCVLLSNNTVKCWGDNQSGQLGNASTKDSKTPVTVSSLSTALELAVGSLHNCVRLSDSTVKCWGDNRFGQLGNGVTTNSNVPATVSSMASATDISVGAHHGCARFSDNTVKCWGRNEEGQLGVGTLIDSKVPVAPSVDVRTPGPLVSGANAYHTCVRQADSTLKCWGINNWELGNGHQVTWTTPSPVVCTSVEVERSDYFVSITTANMHDPAFNGLAANLDVHRVKPVFFPETCTAAQGLVLVHGRTIEAVSAFDLQHEDYSIQEQLAMTGVDTFAMNHLGVGRSSGFSAMSDPCNASLPACLDIGQTCPPPVGVLCDCGPAPTFGVNDKNQQGSTRYLNPNPLTSLCAHTTNKPFTRTTNMVADVDAVVDDALAKTGLSKVNLLGYSAGGVDVGNYLGEADPVVRAARSAKIERAIFVSSLFGGPITDSEPTAGNAVHSYPMGVLDRASATAGGFNLDPVLCPGQRDDASGIQDAIWASIKARDTTGADWGPTQANPEHEGLSRFPHATRWGWTTTSAARISVPVLVMHGLRDNVIGVAASATLYNALTGTASKTIVQIGCASHSIFWEGCTGSTCNGWRGPHATIRKNVYDWIQTGMIYASPGSANGSFGSTDNDGTNFHTVGPTSDGPAADEGNQLP